MRSGVALLLAGATAAVAGTTPGAATLLRPDPIRRPVADSVVLGVFEGRTPCSPIANAFTGFPSATCEKIKWELTLYRDARTQRPTSFVYRGTRTTRQGTWTIKRGRPTDANAEVFRLTSDPPGPTLNLLNIDDQVLLLLDGDLRVVSGDASWSYALNRTSAIPKERSPFVIPTSASEEGSTHRTR